MEVAIYCRESTEKQEIETLVSLCIREAEKLGYKEYKVYKDVESGYSNTRSEYLKLLEDIKAGKIKTLILYESSRLTRDELEHQLVYRLFREKGIKIYTVNHGWLDLNNEDDIFLTSLLNLLDAREGRKTATRVRARMKELCENGRWTGGKAPFGYRLIDKELILVEEEAQIVKEVFESFVSGTSRKNLSRAFGIAPKNLRRMLVNPLYAGELKYHSRMKVNGKWVSQKNYETFKGIHTPIINKEMFEQAQERVKELVPIKSEKASMFKGLLRCPCGANLHFKNRGSIYKKHRYKADYYNCNKYTDVCLKQHVTEEYIYKNVIKEIENVIMELNVDKYSLDRDSIHSSLKLYKNELKKANSNEETLTRNLLNGVIPQEIFEKFMNETKEKKDFLLKKISDSEKILVSENKKSENKELLKNYFQKILKEKDSEKINNFFKIIIEKIVFVNEFRFYIYFKF